TYTRDNSAAVVIAINISSATAPATAAIGVMNVCEVYGLTAALIRRAITPVGGALSSGGCRNRLSSPHSSSSTVTNLSAAARYACVICLASPNAPTIRSIGPSFICSRPSLNTKACERELMFSVPPYLIQEARDFPGERSSAFGYLFLD